MKRLLRSFALSSLLGIIGSASAWNATGHKVIATIALQGLNARVRDEAVRLLAASPNGASTDFVTVSTWADEARTKATAPWHYEDHHFRADGKPTSNQPDAENAVWAIDKFSAILRDKSKSDAERAEALRYLIHFVGDIHQPLHATARDTDEHPTGDRGGNDFRIQPSDAMRGFQYSPRNLHSLWDLGGGYFSIPATVDHSQDAQWITDRAKEVEAKFPRRSLREESQRNPEAWAQESFQISKDFVYSLSETQPVSADYLAKAQEISSRRAALAGYRLADLLNRLLK